MNKFLWSTEKLSDTLALSSTFFVATAQILTLALCPITNPFDTAAPNPIHPFLLITVLPPISAPATKNVPL